MAQASSYDSYSHFVIRTPVFSIQGLSEIPAQEAELFEFVKRQWDNRIVREAIQLASPSFFLLLETEIGQGSISRNIAGSFIRYYTRMCYRCTPFGLFAGIGLGEIAPETKFSISGIHDHILRCRLDMEFLGARVMSWTASPEIRSELSFQTNTSLYEIGEKWRYIEVHYGLHSRKKYQIVAVDKHPVLDEIINHCKPFRSWAIIEKLVLDLGYSNIEAIEFINDLVDSQILVPEINPNLSGEEFSLRLLRKLRHFGMDAGIRQFIKLTDTLAGIDKPGLLSPQFDQICKLAENIDPEFNSGHLIQADLYISNDSALISRDLSNRVLLGIRILKSLSRRRPKRLLGDFKEFFVKRFGSGEVPLPLVMDSEFGTGLFGPQGQQMSDPGPLLDGIDFPVSIEPGRTDYPHPLLLLKMKSVFSSENRYIDLDKKDLKDLGIQKGDWPDQLYALVRLSGQADRIEAMIDLAASGNPTNILGRFGFHDSEGTLNEHITEMVRDDINNHPDQLLAEIVHLPEDRTGNILQRPSYYEWEIPYLAVSGNEAGIIYPDEILVSVKNNAVVLKHKILNKKILPRLSNAHNFRSRQLPLYQFLAECINQDETIGFFPNWGFLADMHDFLPGIRYGSIILSQPRWRIKVDDELAKSSHKGISLYNMIISWTQKYKLPRSIVWVDGDHEMYIDWLNFNIVMAAWASISKKKFVIFKDDPYEKGSPVISESGEHANEVLLSYHKSRR